MTLEKILNAKVLILLNLVIIVATELSGELFLQTGLIHIIALLFLLLGISRIFVHHDAFDPYLRPITFGAIAALVLFAFSHLTEYLNFEGGEEFYADALYVHVTNLYMTAMLLVGLGAQSFLSRKDNARTPVLLMGLGFAAALLVTLLGFMQIWVVSLEPDEASVYLYAAIVTAVTILCINRMLKIGNSVSIMKTFAWYIAIAFFLVAAAALHYLFYELLEDIGLSEVQIVYLSHFAFYAALSFMFLAFPRLARLGGIYGQG